MKPRDAAAIVAIDFSGRGPRVLMGQRSARAVFMPGVYVFPGGRVEPADYRVVPASDFGPHSYERLLCGHGKRLSPAKVRALGVAALREAREEAGIVVEARGARGPALHRLVYAARAITPPGQKRIFDTRFFVLDARFISDMREGDGELSGLDWFRFEEARTAPLHAITRTILDHVETRLKYDGMNGLQQRVPCYFKRGARFVRAHA